MRRRSTPEQRAQRAAAKLLAFFPFGILFAAYCIRFMWWLREAIKDGSQ